MSLSAESDASLDSDQAKFLLTEYESIAHTFCSGLNAMAVLLTLFFIFTGGVLNYVGNLFNDLAKPETHPVLFMHKDFRIWQIYFISAIAIVFTVWSLGFVLVFRDAAGRMLKRASEIEALFPDLSARQKSKLFMLLNDWYSSSTGFSALRLLFWSTVVFYILVFASYFAMVSITFMFRV
jgi:hypothetical protein